jgi:arsenate reductase
MNVDIIHRGTDPTHRRLLESLDGILHDLKQVATITLRDIESAGSGDIWRHLGAPSILIDEIDLEGKRAIAVSPAQRLYDGEPLPPDWLIEAGILRAMKPEHILFMCVANSARSQMAEGITRWLAPPGVEVYSAGSAPTKIDPLTVEVMAEVGIDMSHHFSKGGDAIPVERIDALITLCADEYCPTIPGLRLRLHWALPDPVGADHDARMAAFRAARDELTRRIETLFRCWGASCP